ncbi:uncharacterized protein C8A04DRAFT_34870 [Dichotomopilus funicola]|uniref:RNA polymerase II subunit A C-terminal domain phosphatase n=1 Tax=Dichotomopilus funicola TaxID=1934379 RepID=A0AAN6VAR7_9PEZI|nr:hypothetical protein C8A04DRAFT_34870 [Dichotomopilus funicola]
MAKTVRLGNRLRYPITVVRLLKQPGNKIKKQEPLMEYSFKWVKEVGDSIRGDTWEEEQTTIVNWASPSDGELTNWHIREGQKIVMDRIAMEVVEECSHEIQYQGLCAMCGKDMTEVNWATETRDTARAPINMVHDHTNLTVSAIRAQRTERDLQRRLLESRKLSLVVDLDQTIIQACIDPTVGEWQQDPTNPNHEAAKKIQSFQLDDGPSDLARRCSFYIKMRPGLEEFLKTIAEMYELHVYTMGTRAYAQNVARVVDPDKKLFGNRVISRDENGSIFSKNLQRLFPVSTNMVVIIDDRSDVWPRNRPNLIKVSPYEFFKGIGDINSNFLPKRHDLLTSGSAAKGTKKDKKITSEPVAGGDDSTLLKQQAQEQEREFEKQINDRPLQMLQEKLDREGEEAEKATVQSDDGSESRASSPPPQRHHVLQDDDEELKYLQEHLASLHRAYFAEYDESQASQPASNNDVLAQVPDAGRILSDLKIPVLQGLKIVLSGVLPRGIDIYSSEIGLQIISFGADLRPKISKDVTHLVVNAAQPGRDKLLEARRRPHIKIVSQEWLAACFTQWAAVDETPYLYTSRIVGEHGTAPGGIPSEEDEDDDDEEDEEDDDTDNADGSGSKTRRLANGKPLKLRLLSSSANGQASGESGDDTDLEPGLLPDELPDGSSSPIDGLKTFNWGSADEELAEFLASGSSDDDEDEDGIDDEEDEDEDVDDAQPEPLSANDSSLLTTSPTAGTKRKGRSSDDEDDDDNDNDVDTVAVETGGVNGTPAKRLRRTQSQRASSLRNEYVAGAATATASDRGDDSGLPTPSRSEGQDGDTDGQKPAELGEQEASGEGDDDELEFDDAELEAAFEAGFEKEAAELEAQMVADAALEEGAMDVEKG